jgi:hypothetical protein
MKAGPLESLLGKLCSGVLVQRFLRGRLLRQRGGLSRANPDGKNWDDVWGVTRKDGSGATQESLDQHSRSRRISTIAPMVATTS